MRSNLKSSFRFEINPNLHNAQHVKIDRVFNVVGARAIELTATGARVIIRVLHRRPLAFHESVVIAEKAAVVWFLQFEIHAETICKLNDMQMNHENIVSSVARLLCSQCYREKPTIPITSRWVDHLSGSWSKKTQKVS